MTVIHVRQVGDTTILPQADFERLVALAQKQEAVSIQTEVIDDIPTAGIMRLAEAGGSLDFWKEPGEDIYTLADGEPV